MNKITYVQGDQLVLIDGLGFNGTYDTTPNLHAIQWTPSSYTIEWDTGRPTTESGAYPYQQHIDEWNNQKILADEAERIAEEELEEIIRDGAARAAQIEIIADQLKTKVSLLFTAGGQSLDTDELLVICGQSSQINTEGET